MKSLFALMRYLRNSRGVLAISCVMLLVSSALGIVQPWLTEMIIDKGIQVKNTQVIVLGACAIAIAGILGGIATYVANRFVIRTAQGMAFELRNDLYQKIQTLSFASQNEYRTGELIVRLNSDVNVIRMFFRMGFVVLLQAAIFIGGALFFMYLTNPKLANVLAIFMPLVLVLLVVGAVLAKPLFLKVRTALDLLNNKVQENLAGVRTVRAFARQEEEKKGFEDNNRELYKRSFAAGAYISSLFPLFFFFAQGAVLLTLWFGGRQIITNALGNVTDGLTLGQLIAFNSYAMMAMFPILMLGMVASFISMATASADRVAKLMAEPDTLKIEDNAIDVPAIGGAIEFRDVSFYYGESSGHKSEQHAAPVLSGINLAIKPGEKIGIIGRTGSGKSIMALLMARFFDPTTGAVFIDGQDAKKYSFDSLRGRVAFVFQDTFVFSRSLKENITFAADEVSESRLAEAVDIAQAASIVREKSWDTQLGERGADLSGGQKQRLAIARAIAGSPDVYIFDDATSSLDAATEARVIDGLFTRLAGKTMIFISQKVSAVKRADRIVVLEKGLITGIGHHEELVEANEVYRGICQSQGLGVQQ